MIYLVTDDEGGEVYAVEADNFGEAVEVWKNGMHALYPDDDNCDYMPSQVTIASHHPLVRPSVPRTNCLWEAIGLLRSMVLAGEPMSGRAESAVEVALAELGRLEESIYSIKCGATTKREVTDD